MAVRNNTDMKNKIQNNTIPITLSARKMFNHLESKPIEVDDTCPFFGKHLAKSLEYPEIDTMKTLNMINELPAKTQMKIIASTIDHILDFYNGYRGFLTYLDHEKITHVVLRYKELPDKLKTKRNNQKVAKVVLNVCAEQIQDEIDIEYAPDQNTRKMIDSLPEEYQERIYRYIMDENMKKQNKVKIKMRHYIRDHLTQGVPAGEYSIYVDRNIAKEAGLI